MHVHVLADGNLIASHAILISLLFVFVNLGIIDFHFIHEFRFWHFVIFYNFIKICGKVVPVNFTHIQRRECILL